MLLALAAGGAFLAPATQAQTVTAVDGDMFLGIRAGGGTGATKDYVIDIGQASQFENATGVLVLSNLGNVGADLTATFGATWYNRSDIFWGIAGTTGQTSSINGDPIRTLFATAEEPTPGTESTPWVRLSGTAQSQTANKVIGMMNAFIGGTQANGIGATIQTTSDTNSWASYQPGGTSANSGPSSISFAVFNPSIEGSFGNGTSGSMLDLFRMQPSSTPGINGDYLGRFIMNNSGQLTFVPVAAFGTGTVTIENSTYTVNQTTGTLQVNVTRTGDLSSAASVNFSTADSTAVGGTDFTTITNQVLNFGINQSTVTVPVTISANARSGTFGLALSSLSSGQTVGANGTAAVTISVPVVASVIDLASATFTANQSATSVTINLVRTVGTSAVSVNIATPGSIDDTAVAGTDYVVPTGASATVSFAANVNVGSATVTLSPQSGVQPNKQFAVSLTSPSAHASIGTTQPAATVRILADDTVPPSVTITAPLANATIPGPNVTIAGTSFDNIGVDEVQVSLNGGAFTDATLSPTGTGATWSLTLPAAGGLNTVRVQAFDAKRNASPLVSRSFTYVKKSSLNVTVVTTGGGTGGTVAGALSAVGTPYTVGSTYSLTATAKPGFVFNGWTVQGLSGPTTEVPKLMFVFNDALASSGPPPTITATFIVNPFVGSKIGAFSGLVKSHAGTTASNSTTGFINLTVTATGAFTGTLKIDGLTLPVSGLFDNSGVARFGTARTSSLTVPRVVRPALVLALNLDLTGTSGKITGTVTQYRRSTVIATSDVDADRAAFSAIVPVSSTGPANYLANKGLYTIVLPAKAQPLTSDLTIADYPQGDGIGTLTVMANGSVTLSGTLADGTAITANAPLSKNYTVPVYAQLYAGNTGSFSGVATLNLMNLDSDVSGTDFDWFRPWINEAQYYPWGWDEGVKIDLIGAQYANTAGSTVLKKPGGPSVPLSLTSPNASLTFSDGGLASSFSKNVTISTANVVSTGTPADKSFSLTLTAGTGKIAGSLTHTDGTMPKFQGILLQKGANAGGYGFFLTVAPKVVDGTGLSGGISLIGN